MTQQEKTSPAEIYEEYLVPGIHARWTPLFLDHADPQPAERVLDVACGTGIVTRNVAPLVETDGSVVALDVNPEMLAVAKALPRPAGAPVEWHEGDATAMPLPDDTFDLVLCQQGLQFFANRAQAVQEMRRVMAPDGRVTLSVWQSLDHHPLYQALIEAEARYLDVPTETVATPFTVRGVEELRALFNAAGFRHLEVAPASHPVRFPSPERFVMLTLLAAASIIPESEMNREARAEMVRAISQEIDAILQEYVDGDSVSFPMHAHIAVARG